MDAGKDLGHEYPPKGTFTPEQLRQARLLQSAQVRADRRAAQELEEQQKAAADPVRVKAKDAILQDFRQRNPR